MSSFIPQAPMFAHRPSSSPAWHSLLVSGALSRVATRARASTLWVRQSVLVLLLAMALGASGCTRLSDTLTKVSEVKLWPFNQDTEETTETDTAQSADTAQDDAKDTDGAAQADAAQADDGSVSTAKIPTRPAGKDVTPPKITTRAGPRVATAPQAVSARPARDAIATSQPTQQRTAVGQHVTQLAQTVEQLRNNIGARRQGLDTLVLTGQQRSSAFYSHLAAMNTKLRNGTTPGNPIVTSRMNQAQAVLDSVTSDVTSLKGLYGNVSSDSSLAVYLSSSLTSAYSLYGAVDADHDRIDELRDHISRMVVDVDRLLNELTDEIARQSNYLAVEQDNLRTMRVAIENGELYGPSLQTAAIAGVRYRAAERIADPADGRNRKPFITLRFEGIDLDYEGALYQAASQAITSNPNTIFDIVAVSTSVGDTAHTSRQAGIASERANEVLRTMVGFGLPANQLTLTDATSNDTATHEIRIFIR